VYQAIGNVIANHSSADLRVFADRLVYAHIYAGPQSDFMLRYWRPQYRAFMRSLATLWSRGNHWLVRADIASYYDSIDHQSLLILLRGLRISDDGLLALLQRCLRCWSPHEGGHSLDRGLPQGYETSDFLSTLFLYPVEQKMCSKGHDTVYRRYVDDVRLLLHSRQKAQRALIDFDLALKSVGLIVQTSKTSISQVNKVDDLRDPDWGVLSLVEQGMPGAGAQAQPELRRIFFEGLDALATSDFAERHVVFALKRLGPYEDVRDQVLRLLETMPWRSGVLVNHLRQFSGDSYTVERLRGFIENHHVYGWHLANCLDCLVDIAPPDATNELCRTWVSSRELPWYQRLAAAQGLGELPQSLPFCSAKAEEETSNQMVRRGLLSSCYKLANDREEQSRIIRIMLRDQDEETKRTGIFFLLTNDDLSWEEFTGMEDDLGQLRNLVPELVPSDEDVAGRCYIAKTLADFFRVTAAADIDLQPVFGCLYRTAKQHLQVAIGAHDTAWSRYVARLDNFNNVVMWCIYDNLLPNDVYQRDDTLNNLNRSTFRQLCPVVAGAFSRCHELRSRCAEPHAYSKSLGAVSREVSREERDRVTSSLRGAYDEFVSLFV
jgi:hypothetical protein